MISDEALNTPVAACGNAFKINIASNPTATDFPIASELEYARGIAAAGLSSMQWRRSSQTVARGSDYAERTQESWEAKASKEERKEE